MKQQLWTPRDMVPESGLVMVKVVISQLLALSEYSGYGIMLLLNGFVAFKNPCSNVSLAALC